MLEGVATENQKRVVGEEVVVGNALDVHRLASRQGRHGVEQQQKPAETERQKVVRSEWQRVRDVAVG
jgi:hypothetical protein